MSLKSAKQSVLAGGRCKSRARERRLGMLSKGHGNKPGARRGPHIGDWNSLQEAKGEVRKESDATVVSEMSKLRLGKAPGRLRAHTGGGKQGASCSVSGSLAHAAFTFLQALNAAATPDSGPGRPAQHPERASVWCRVHLCIQATNSMLPTNQWHPPCPNTDTPSSFNSRKHEAVNV